MKYRLDRYGNQISQLGYGCLRFTKKGNSIDYEKAEKEVLLAIEQGAAQGQQHGDRYHQFHPP